MAGADAEDWIDVGAAAALSQGGRLDVEVDGHFVAVVQTGDGLHAFEDRCTHDGEPLAGAEIEPDAATPCGVVVCPRHGARFCLRTGEALTPPAYEPLRIFSARERD
ncbi:MAG: ferredoxin, partial [Gammaproteobacteria bacterium]|nr:ferredoxin [Gammaproteobacteria bacterium]